MFQRRGDMCPTFVEVRSDVPEPGQGPRELQIALGVPVNEWIVDERPLAGHAANSLQQRDVLPDLRDACLNDVPINH